MACPSIHRRNPGILFFEHGLKWKNPFGQIELAVKRFQIQLHQLKAKLTHMSPEFLWLWDCLWCCVVVWEHYTELVCKGGINTRVRVRICIIMCWWIRLDVFIHHLHCRGDHAVPHRPLRVGTETMELILRSEPADPQFRSRTLKYMLRIFHLKKGLFYTKQKRPSGFIFRPTVYKNKFTGKHVSTPSG